MRCGHKNVFKLILPLLFSLPTLHAESNLARLVDASPDYFVRNFRMQDGLPSDQVRDILQSDDGYL